VKAGDIDWRHSSENYWQLSYEHDGTPVTFSRW